MSKQYLIASNQKGKCPKGVDCQAVINHFVSLHGSGRDVRETDILFKLYLDYYIKETKSDAYIKLYVAFDFVKQQLKSKNVHIIEDIKEKIKHNTYVSDVYGLNSPYSFKPSDYNFSKQVFELLRRKGQVDKERTLKEVDATVLERYLKKRYSKYSSKDYTVMSGFYYETKFITFLSLLYLNSLSSKKNLETRFKKTVANIKRTFLNFTDLYVRFEIPVFGHGFVFDPSRQDYRIYLGDLMPAARKGQVDENQKAVLDVLDYPDRIANREIKPQPVSLKLLENISKLIKPQPVPSKLLKNIKILQLKTQPELVYEKIDRISLDASTGSVVQHLERLKEIDLNSVSLNPVLAPSV